MLPEPQSMVITIPIVQEKVIQNPIKNIERHITVGDNPDLSTAQQNSEVETAPI